MGNVDRSENPKRPKVDYDKDKSLNRDNNPLFGEGYADFDDCLPHSEYIKQQRTLLKELTRALTDEGAIFYNTKCATMVVKSRCCKILWQGSVFVKSSFGQPSLPSVGMIECSHQGMKSSTL